MDKAEIDNLIEVSSDVDQDALRVLHKAWEEKFEDYKSDNSKAKLAEWQAAEKALKAKVDELTAKYLGPADVRILENVVEAWRFLQSEGYKVGRQSVYRAKDSGKLIVQADGSVSESDALAFAAKHLKKIKPKGAKIDDKLYEEKATEELLLLKVRREKTAFEFAKDKGKYILKSDARNEIAIKIATLEAGIKHLFRTFLPDWIHKAGGSAKKSPMILELVNSELDGLLNEFGRMPDIGVVIVKDGDNADHMMSDDDPEGGIFEFGETYQS